MGVPITQDVFVQSLYKSIEAMGIDVFKLKEKVFDLFVQDQVINGKIGDLNKLGAAGFNVVNMALPNELPLYLTRIGDQAASSGAATAVLSASGTWKLLTEAGAAAVEAGADKPLKRTYVNPTTGATVNAYALALNDSAPVVGSNGDKAILIIDSTVTGGTRTNLAWIKYFDAKTTSVDQYMNTNAFQPRVYNAATKLYGPYELVGINGTYDETSPSNVVDAIIKAMADLIDDEAGLGDMDVTWSANKLQTFKDQTEHDIGDMSKLVTITTSDWATSLEMASIGKTATLVANSQYLTSDGANIALYRLHTATTNEYMSVVHTKGSVLTAFVNPATPNTDSTVITDYNQFTTLTQQIQDYYSASLTAVDTATYGTGPNQLTQNTESLWVSQTVPQTFEDLVTAINSIASDVHNLDYSDLINDTAAYGKDITYSATKIRQVVNTARSELKAEILGGADSAYDTLKEIQSFLDGAGSSVQALLTLLSKALRADTAQTWTAAEKTMLWKNLGMADDTYGTNVDFLAVYTAASTTGVNAVV